jgi:hypothetical protein
VVLVENVTGGTVWPGGRTQVRVVGFAWFVISGVFDNGKRVDGVFIRASSPGEGTATGPITSATGVYDVQLVS